MLNYLNNWQKKAIRGIAGLSPNESFRSYFKELNVMTVPSLYIYKNLNKFDLRMTIHDHGTRSGHKIDVPYARLAKTHN